MDRTMSPCLRAEGGGHKERPEADELEIEPPNDELGVDDAVALVQDTAHLAEF